MNTEPTPAQIAFAKGYAAFRMGDDPCPYNHFTERDLVDAYYQGMAHAETEYGAGERA
jgi:hypothetical protein